MLDQVLKATTSLGLPPFAKYALVLYSYQFEACLGRGQQHSSMDIE